MTNPYSVSRLIELLKDIIAHEVGPVRVEGEVSKLTFHRSGHWYFTIQDAHSSLSCVMFRGDNRRLQWRPVVGEQVVLDGVFDVYAPQGRLSFLARMMARAGAGDRQARLEALKKKLSDEGLFDPAHKKRLPALPRAIGVATSPTGAALQDILRVLDRRFPGMPVYFAPCRVQGENAAREIVHAIGLLDAHGGSDVLIVGRGGGAKEDLYAFDEEVVARAIAACSVPVVSAVGHEIDVSVSDLVADVRAATPSHAAELVVPERAAILQLLAEFDGRMHNAIDRTLSHKRERLARIRLRHPSQRLADARLQVTRLHQQLQTAVKRDVERQCARVQGLSGRLDALSPISVLGRGYAVVLRDGQALKSVDGLHVGEMLNIRLQEGEVSATVSETRGGPREG